MAQDPLRRLLSFVTPMPPAQPLPKRDYAAQPLGPAEQSIDAILGLMGIKDPLAQDASVGTGVGAMLGMASPIAAGRGLFSRVDDALRLVPKGGAHPNKVLGLLKNNASTEELAYRGVPEFLAAQGNRVTPEALQAHLAARPAPMPQTKVLKTEAGGTLFGDGTPKYDPYQVPGGTNYRETLSVMPPSSPSSGPLADKVKTFTLRYGPDYRQHLTNGEINELDALSLDPSTRDRTSYASVHFPETPNILVHSRSNQRTLPTGERGTLVENVQSDWHQAGRKRGYQVAPQRNMEGKIIENPAYDRVPDAPFKESWPALGLKQEVLNAVERGDDWIGITPAATLNARGEAISEAFQDQRLPLTLEKILQPFGGGRVERGTVNAGPRGNLGIHQNFEDAAPTASGLTVHEGMSPVLSVLSQGTDGVNSRVASELLDQIKRTRTRAPITTEAFLARLTPEMRAQIKEKGLPLLMAVLAAQGMKPVASHGR